MGTRCGFARAVEQYSTSLAVHLRVDVGGAPYQGEMEQQQIRRFDAALQDAVGLVCTRCWFM